MLHTHQKENNSASQAILDFNRERLTKQCEKVLNLLKEGKRLTVKDALLEYGIGSLPRRILDLKENGIPVKSRMVGNRYKEYYLDAA